MAFRSSQNTQDLFAYADSNNQPAVVYMATNTVNGKRYIGITKFTLDKRKRLHFASVRHGSNLKFHNAIRKYGVEAFDFCVILECASYQEVKAAEQRLIAMHRPEYNLTKGGDGAVGYNPSKSTRLKMSSAKKGKPGVRLGMTHSQETKDRISAKRKETPTRFWLGKRRDATTAAKIRETKLARGLSQNMQAANAGRQKPVFCITDGLAFANPKIAAAHYGCSHGLIIRVCRCGNERPWKVKKTFVYAEDWFL